jgi:hypothetical protein
MASTSTAVDSDDPFAGCGPQPVRCQWLTEDDAARAPTATVVRLIVDDQRGHSEAWANDRYQAHFLREVSAFIGPSSAVVMTDAGCIKARIADHPATMGGLSAGLKQLNEALTSASLGEHELLLGLDGCLHGRSTDLQTVAHVRGRAALSLDNVAIKLHATGEESSLIGSRLCRLAGAVPDELKKARRMETAAGSVLVLVCNDAAIFGARSRTNLRDEVGLAIRDHFRQAADPPPDYILVATHVQWFSEKNGVLSGAAFRQAAEHLHDLTGSTVVVTTRGPAVRLSEVADAFPVIGPKRDAVATLLVFDTSESSGS